MKFALVERSSPNPWGPEDVDHRGLGGSETAMVRVAEHLAQLGHCVVVCNSGSGTAPRKVSGVIYVNWTCAPSDADVYVFSRDPTLLRDLHPRRGITALWVHDAFCLDDWEGHVRRHDVVLCLSVWSKRNVMEHTHTPASKIVLTRNGIEPSLYLRKGELALAADLPPKSGCRVAYTSSPDRGLAHLLDLWPQIRERVPGAELDVCCGFDNWLGYAEAERDRLLEMRVQYLRHRVCHMADQGVRYRVLLGQPALARVLMDSRLWLYPTSFCETSCIAAMEAMAAGAWVVTSRAGALPETVSYYGSLVGGRDPMLDDSFDADFVQEVAAASQPTVDREAFALGGRRHALTELTWAGVARQWESMFRLIGRS